MYRNCWLLWIQVFNLQGICVWGAVYNNTHINVFLKLIF